MIHSEAAAAFDLSQEPAKVRESYGKGVFGQGCLLARRLVEHGVPFVEVSLSSSSAGSFGWDTHANNFEAVKALSAELDAGWASLMTDLAERGLLESTTIVWMGEFGRTPQINGQAGRDHFPRAWSCVLGGGGIAGGQAYGRTSADGMDIEEDPVEVTDVLATLCSALGVPPETENMSNTGRPIKIVELVDGCADRQTPGIAACGLATNKHEAGQTNSVALDSPLRLLRARQAPSPPPRPDLNTAAPIATCKLQSLPTNPQPPYDRTAVLYSLQPPADDPLANYQRTPLGDWQMPAEADRNDPWLRLLVFTPSDLSSIDLAVFVDGKSFREKREAWVDEVLSAAKSPVGAEGVPGITRA